MSSRRLWMVGFVLVGAIGALLLSQRDATSWHYFNDAAHTLLQPKRSGPEGGLDLFASHPEFQFGPISVLTAVPFAFLPSAMAHWLLFPFTLALGCVAL